MIISGNGYVGRYLYKSYSFGKKLNKFELAWIKEYKEYPDPVNSDVVDSVKKYVQKQGL